MTRDALQWRRLRDKPVELACCGWSDGFLFAQCC